MSVQTIVKQAEDRMQKGLESLRTEFTKIRSGRAHPSLLDHVKVMCYGSESPLSQVASVSVEDARSLVVSPWDKSLSAAIEKAIRTADLGLNPASQGTVIRVPLPALNEERRKEMVKIVRTEAEDSRVGIRNIRRDANQEIKQVLKDKVISEDEARRAEDTIQKLTDKWVEQIEKLLEQKEKELMEV